MKHISKVGLKVSLILLGLFTIYLSIDFGFGGFTTLGWQGTSDFLQITNQTRYAEQDSNFRFFVGTFGFIGIYLIYATTDLKKHHQHLNFTFLMVFVGGLTRLVLVTSPNLPRLLLMFQETI